MIPRWRFGVWRGRSEKCFKEGANIVGLVEGSKTFKARLHELLAYHFCEGGETSTSL